MAAVGAFLVATAALKGHEVAYRGAFRSYLLLIVPEYLLGLWLLSGLYGKAARLVAMLFFAGFLETALWAALAGRKSCGCLGVIDINPRLMVVIDFGVLAGLALLRPAIPERTVLTHRLRYRGFLIMAIAFGVPGFLTTTAFRRESPRAHVLRHDPVLHDTRVAVHQRQPSTQDLLGLLAKAGLRVSVDDAVKPYFHAPQPVWKTIKDHTSRSWAVFEAISDCMPVKTRWLKANGVYVLIEDDPLRRAKPYWLSGLAFGALGLGWLAWGARQGETRTGLSARAEDLPALNAPVSA